MIENKFGNSNKLGGRKVFSAVYESPACFEPWKLIVEFEYRCENLIYGQAGLTLN